MSDFREHAKKSFANSSRYIHLGRLTWTRLAIPLGAAVAPKSAEGLKLSSLWFLRLRSAGKHIPVRPMSEVRSPLVLASWPIQAAPTWFQPFAT